MKILFISALFPYPLHSGGQVRLFHLLRELSKEHTITLFCYTRSEEEDQYIRNMPFCPVIRTFLRGTVWQPKYLWNAVTGRHPLLMASYDLPHMKKAIAEELSTHQYDVVHIEPFYVFPVLPHTDLPLVVSEHNIEYKVYDHLIKTLPTPLGKAFGKWDVKKMRKQEEAVWQKADAVTAVSSDEAVYIQKRTDPKKVSVVPNGIDPGYFTYRERAFDPAHPKFLFVGNFSWKPNEDALRLLLKRYWPRIGGMMPGAQMTVCGKHLSSGLDQMLRENGISYIPMVEDIRSLYADHDILLAPFSYGGGTKFKLLEAMASGTLVITTKPGIEGIDAEDKKHALIADSDDAFIADVSYAYANPQKALGMTKQARRLVEKTYNWEAIAQTLATVWKTVV